MIVFYDELTRKASIIHEITGYTTQCVFRIDATVMLTNYINNILNAMQVLGLLEALK